MNKTLSIHREAIASGLVNASNVRGIRMAINKMERAGAGWTVPAYVTPEWRREVMELEEFLEDRIYPPTVEGKLHHSGVKVLRSPRYKSRWTPNQAAVIAELDHFKLVRFERIGRQGDQCTPVFRAVGYSGLGFNFINIPWQSGGNGPEVVD